MTESFGTMPDGTPVYRQTISGGGLSASVMSYGAVLQDLRLAGHDEPLVLGFGSLADYLAHSPYFGAIVGRCANRIRGGSFTLDGESFGLDRNSAGGHTLHGGTLGTGKRVWQIESRRADRITLCLELADGEMGFPGILTARCTYALLPGGVLDIRLAATTDRATLCNLAHHSYFNLDGAATILDHRLSVAAERYTPVDDELIPTGEVLPVAGSGFDFRRPLRLGDAGVGGAVDHNLCLSDTRVALRDVARLESPASGVTMDIRTTEPGLQVYTGAQVNCPVAGLNGRSMGAYSGVALEAQLWPDAAHNPGFPTALLRPGESYAQRTQFIFKGDAK